MDGIDPITLAPADDKTLPLDEAAEALRAKTVAHVFSATPDFKEVFASRI